MRRYWFIIFDALKNPWYLLARGYRLFIVAKYRVYILVYPFTSCVIWDRLLYLHIKLFLYKFGSIFLNIFGAVQVWGANEYRWSSTHESLNEDPDFMMIQIWYTFRSNYTLNFCLTPDSVVRGKIFSVIWAAATVTTQDNHSEGWGQPLHNTLVLLNCDLGLLRRTRGSFSF